MIINNWLTRALNIHTVKLTNRGVMAFQVMLWVVWVLQITAVLLTAMLILHHFHVLPHIGYVCNTPTTCQIGLK